MLAVEQQRRLNILSTMDGNCQKSVKILGHNPGTGSRCSELYGILGKHGIYPGKMHAGLGVFFPIIKESEIEEMLKEDIIREARD